MLIALEIIPNPCQRKCNLDHINYRKITSTELILAVLHFKSTINKMKQKRQDTIKTTFLLDELPQPCCLWGTSNFFLSPIHLAQDERTLGDRAKTARRTEENGGSGV